MCHRTIDHALPIESIWVSVVAYDKYYVAQNCATKKKSEVYEKIQNVDDNDIPVTPQNKKKDSVDPMRLRASSARLCCEDQDRQHLIQRVQCETAKEGKGWGGKAHRMLDD